jgi:Ni/Fe-hydrogenase b-type cytochrome subunit
MGAGRAGMATPAALRDERYEYRWVYLWHWPIRAMHWAAAASIVLLLATGFYIGKPYFVGGPESQSPFVMGTMRFLHFLGAGVLVATGIVRIYWLLAGNRYERLPALFPVRPKDLRNLVRIVRYYLLIRPEQAPHYLGHNPLQQLSYTAIYLLTAFMVLTGFTLYGLHNPGSFFYQLGIPIGWLLGGAQGVRFWHHVLSWAFLIFLPIHVYLALRADITEREGAISSIINGGKFVRADMRYEDE